MIRIIFPLLLILLTACNATEKSNNTYQITETVSGTVALYPHKHKLSALYISFTIVEQDDESGQETMITTTSFKSITRQKIPFSLDVPVERIRKENRYLLSTTISEDAHGKTQVASMTTPIITQGQPSTLSLVIKFPVEIE